MATALEAGGSSREAAVEENTIDAARLLPLWPGICHLSNQGRSQEGGSQFGPFELAGQGFDDAQRLGIVGLGGRVIAG